MAQILSIVTAGPGRAFENMKNYTIKRIDRRYSGSHFAQYRIQINDDCNQMGFPDKVDLYRRMRDWCTDTWGHSCEVRYHGYFEYHRLPYNLHWAWSNPGKYHLFYFYLASDAELTMFQLKF